MNWRCAHLLCDPSCREMQRRSIAPPLFAAMIGGAFIDSRVQPPATLASGSSGFDALRWVVMSLENDFTRYPLSIYTAACARARPCSRSPS